MRTKTSDTYYIDNDFTNVTKKKFMKSTSNQEQAVNTKRAGLHTQEN